MTVRESVLVVLVLALAGCGPAASRPAASRPAASQAAVAPAAASVAAPNGVDVLFAQMMVVHHAQAVRLSRIVLAKPEVNEPVSRIAGFIAQDQQREIDETNAWLVAWGRPVADPADPVVQRMHGDGDAAAAHGMLSERQMQEVEAAAPARATELFLRQMIAHHTGAITMSRSVLADGTNVHIRNLAAHIVNEQTAENEVMRELLKRPRG